MPRRLLIIAITITALVIPAVIAIFVITRNPKIQNSVLKLANINTSANVNVVVANTNTAVQINTNAAVVADTAQITFVSRNFAELYGSGSNQNNFSNIVEAEKWTTKSMADFLNTSITQQRAGLKTTPYHEIITTALVINVLKQTAATAGVTVSTQRQETIDRATKVYYQDLLVDLVKVGVDWKVNTATWKAL